MASSKGTDYLCSPAKSWLQRYEQLEDIAYPTVVEDVVEPFGQGHLMTSTPYRSRSHSADRAGGELDQKYVGDKEVRFDQSASERSRSPVRSGARYGNLENRNSETQVKSPVNVGSLTIDDIVKRYSLPKELPVVDDRERSQSPSGRSRSKSPSDLADRNIPPPTIPAQMTYSPYRGPIQDEIHTQPYYGPIVSTIRTDVNEPSPVRKGQGSGDAARIINKVHNKVSDERIEELSSRYRERMARKQYRQTKAHYRSKSDNFRSDLDEGVPRSKVKGHTDDWMVRKFENAVLQIEKLESTIKCLRMEVNSLTASKKQAEMRVSNLGFVDYLQDYLPLDVVLQTWDNKMIIFFKVFNMKFSGDKKIRI